MTVTPTSKRGFYFRTYPVHLLALLCFWSATVVKANLDRKVKLQDVTSLTFQLGVMTAGRRLDPVPQLTCIPGGTVSCTAPGHPPTVQCYKRGFDGLDVKWECKADLDSNYQFGHVEVNCEGFDYPEDPYVLAGSCGLEFNLNYVAKNMEERGEPPAEFTELISKISIKLWVLLIVIGFLMYLVYRTYLKKSEAIAAGDETSAFWTGVGTVVLLGAAFRAWVTQGRRVETKNENFTTTTQRRASTAVQNAVGLSGVLVEKSGFGRTTTLNIHRISFFVYWRYGIFCTKIRMYYH